MKKLILFLFLSTSLFCFGQGKSALKDIQSIKFYGVDYSQAKVFGADESPIQFKDAFRRINELFITEAKKYNVGKQLIRDSTYSENAGRRYGIYRTVPGQIKQQRYV